MYSLSVRLNAIFFNYIIYLAILGGFNILTTIFIVNQPKINKFDIKSTSLYHNKYTRHQQSNGILTMDIDFEPTFDWNTNLIFSWISAEYEVKGKNVSVTIWDRIMRRNDTDRHHLVKSNIPFKYPIIDLYQTLAGKEVNLELHWEHMPVIGPIIKRKVSLGTMKIIKQKTNPSRNEILQEFDYSDRDNYND